MKSVQKGSRRKSFDLCESVSYVAVDHIDIYIYCNLNFESYNSSIQNILGEIFEEKLLLNYGRKDGRNDGQM